MAEFNPDSQQVGKMLDPETWGQNLSNVMEKFIETASVESAYGQPVAHGEHLVIPTAEVVSVAGYGLGLGGGYAAPEDGEQEPNLGGGGGGGGGGKMISRPVAVVIAGPEGVRVEPVVDITKLWIAALTAAGFMVATFFQMRGNKDPQRSARRMSGDLF